MRTLTLAFLLFISACSTRPKNVYQQQIDEEIKQSTLNADIGYEQGILEKVADVNVKKSISDLETELHRKLTDDWEKALSDYTEVFEQAKKDNNSNAYHVAKWELARMQKLRRMKPLDIEYSVFKYSYLRNNEFNPNATKRKVVSYYFFDGSKSLIGQMDKPAFDEYKANAVQTDTQPYHIALMTIETEKN